MPISQTKGYFKNSQSRFLEKPMLFGFKMKILKKRFLVLRWLLGLRKLRVFKKDRQFANPTYFASCITKKHYFLIWTKKTAFFPYFYCEIFFYSAELFDGAINFKFYLNIFYIFKQHKSKIEGARFEMKRSSHLL